MAEPTSVYSLKDLILRTAKAAGVAYYGSDGQGRATIPVDEHNFERCLDCVNDGIKMFISQAPPNGWRWRNRIAEITFGTVETTGTVDSGGATTLVDDDLEDTYDEDDDINGYYVYDTTQEIYALITDYTASGGTVTVSEWLDYEDNPSSLTPAANDAYSITDVKTVNGDLARYWLPDDFQGEYSGEITYAKDTGIGHVIDWVGEGTARFYREVSVSDGYPNKAAVRPSPARRRWELFVDPAPTEAHTVTFPYKAGFNKLEAISGTASNGSSTVLTDTTIVNLYPDDYFNGWYIYILSGTGRNSYAKVTDYANDANSGIFTVADWLSLDGSAGGKDPDTATDAYFVAENYKHPAGPQFDEAILSACKAVAELEFEDLNMGYGQKFVQFDLPKAYEIDARSAPKKLGPMLSGSGRRFHERVWKDVEED